MDSVWCDDLCELDSSTGCMALPSARSEDLLAQLVWTQTCLLFTISWATWTATLVKGAHVCEMCVFMSAKEVVFSVATNSLKAVCLQDYSKGYEPMIDKIWWKSGAWSREFPITFLCICGSMVTQCLGLLSHSQKLLGSKPSVCMGFLLVQYLPL